MSGFGHVCSVGLHEFKNYFTDGPCCVSGFFLSVASVIFIFHSVSALTRSKTTHNWKTLDKGDMSTVLAETGD